MVDQKNWNRSHLMSTVDGRDREEWYGRGRAVWGADVNLVGVAGF